MGSAVVFASFATLVRMRRTLYVVAALAMLAIPLAGAASASAQLPDGRAWEMVSPATKNGTLVVPNGYGLAAPSGGVIASSEDGNSVTYVANSPVTPEPEGNRATEGNQVVSQRSSGGWSAEDIVTPHLKGEGFAAGESQEYHAFSNSLSLALLAPFSNGNPFQEPPLVANAGPEELGLYLRHRSTPCGSAPAPCYEPVVTPENDTAGTPFGNELKYHGGSADLNHLVFQASVPLVGGAPPEGTEALYEWNAGVPASEQLQLVSQLPPAQANKPVIEPELGNNRLAFHRSVRNAVSNDGSRVFWTALTNEESNHPEANRNLYMRRFARDAEGRLTGTTMEVESRQGKFVAEGHGRFQTASTDGSKVFFTDTLKLTADSNAESKEGGEQGKADLYVCEIDSSDETAETCPSSKMTDLTGSTHGFSEPGDVVGDVIGASEDGRTIYFVANGAADGASAGTCPNPNSVAPSNGSESCNLYMVHQEGSTWEPPRFIAALSGGDGPDWAKSGTYLVNLTSRVSPNGRFVAFMSERPLTDYNNEDASPAAHGARDEEVFLYDSSGEGKLVCPSCNPDSEHRPTGVLDIKEAGEGNGLLVDPLATVWTERWLAGSIPAWTALEPHEALYQSHFLLNNGRLYFDSADSLVEEDKNERLETIPGEGPQKVGVEDVYQYEPEGTGSCSAGENGTGGCVSLISSGTSGQESAFLDANEFAGEANKAHDGDNVFLLTSQPLVPTDIDDVGDIYDARICTSESPCLTPPPPPALPCSNESSCRTNNGGIPDFGSATSEAPIAISSAPKQQTLPSKVSVSPKPAKPLTRPQKLARALRACRKAHKHSKRKRAACEKSARAKYGSKHKAAKK